MRCRGDEWYGKQKIEIVGERYISGDTGRIVYPIYAEGSAAAETIAKGRYTTVTDIIRETSPDDFGRIQRWQALGTGNAPEQARGEFASLMANIETGEKTP